MTIVFFTSLLLTSTFLVIKYWEVSTGKKVWGSHRATADVFIENQIHKQITEIPNFVHNTRISLKNLVVLAIHGIIVVALSAVQFVEKHLVSAVDSIKGKHNVQKRRSVSPFLKKMGEEDRD